MDLGFTKIDWQHLSDEEVAKMLNLDNRNEEELVDYYLMVLREYRMAAGIIDDIAAFRDKDDAVRYDRIVKYMEKLPEVKLYLIQEEKKRLKRKKRRRLIAIRNKALSIVTGKKDKKRSKKQGLILGLKRKK